MLEFKISKRLAVGLVLVAILGIANATVFNNIAALPGWFKGGVWFGPAAVQAVPASKLTVIAAPSGGSVSLNLGGAVVDAGTYWDTGATTVTGAAVGDNCLASPRATTLDGGTTFSVMDVTCYVSATNAIKFRLKNPSANNLTSPDQEFRPLVISNQ